MQHDPTNADAPQRWLEDARSDLVIARIPLPPGARYEQLCFHTQQAAEKSIKAVLIKHEVDFPFTHNLQVLVSLIPAGLPMPPVLAEAVDLNLYAVTTRYPGETEPVTEDEYHEALRVAEAVFEWAESVVSQT